ncbi:PREDICTED: dolichol kinase EVAN [Nelumbo nucifera]|uniref:dolichol kinase n=1 Tax=Nelumbo nucifera TaxID=4432 RepID=A0A1U7ZPZ5_NELNU|nr:PREDICTED: dolichol kinase EVAN [Nelumbo nucifera]
MAAMSVSLNNGERTVVLLFISCVLFSLPLSLLYQGFALCLLTLAGLFVEVSAENSTSLSRFKTRPGASSGILLGAVTLPAVMFSRLIQLSRAVASYDVGTEEVGYLNMQYWAVSASCFSVLVLLHLVSRHSSSNTGSSWLGSFQDRKFGIICIPLYATVCCMSLATNSHGGFHVAMELLWVLSHGLAAVKLIQHILHTFPSCASIGEALLVTAGLVLYFGDMLAYTFGKIIAYSISSRLLSLQFGSKRSEIGTIIQGVLYGLLLFPILYKFILQIWAHFISIDYSEACTADERTSKGIGRSLLFYASLAVTLVVIVPTWMQFVQDFHVHPLSWVFTFVFMEPFKRLALCIYWIGVICLSVVRFYNISKNSKIERVLLRKYYHMVAVLMFVPAIIFEPNFLDLAFGVALAVFLALEIVRVWKIWPLWRTVHHFMNAFTDHRDSDLLIVSHFSLLLGCALPKWISTGFNDRPLAPLAGILSLGIGDTMASMVGHKYGVLRWSKTGKKTVEGTAAGITSVLAACSVLLPLLASTSYILSQHWISLLLAVTVSGLLEAYTAQLDNAFIPLVFYSLLCL